MYNNCSATLKQKDNELIVVLDSKENDLITSLFLNGHIELKPSVDFMGFVKSITA